jgi:glucose/arabinose dehydrogenase
VKRLCCFGCLLALCAACNERSPAGRAKAMPDVAESTGGASSPIDQSDDPKDPGDPPLGPLKLVLEEVALAGDPQGGTEIAFVPGTGELLLLLQTGRVLRYEQNGAAFDLLDEVQLPDVAGYDDCGLVSVAFDPDFAENGLVYFGHCTSGTASRITRYTWSGEALDSMLDSQQEIIFVEEPSATRPWHNVGAIGFDNTGAHWAQFGEKTIQSNSQDPTRDLGKLLRILPDPNAPGGHVPAPDNPWLAGDGGADPDVYALGLRSPWKGVYDSARHRWVIGDVGASDVEELNVVTAPEQNFGWPIAEGPCRNLSDTAICAGLTEPLIDYPHQNQGRYVEEDPDSFPTNSRAIWVAGPFSALPENDPYGGRLDGRFLFGDMFAGWVRALRLDDSAALVSDELIGHLRFATAWAQSPEGYVYGIRFGDYKGHSDDPRVRLYRARPADATDM